MQAFISETPGFALSLEGIYNNFNRPKDAIDVLRRTQVARQTVEVYGNSGFYKDMMIKEWEVVTNLENLQTVQLNITMQQLIFVGQAGEDDPFDDQYKRRTDRGSLQMLEGSFV